MSGVTQKEQRLRGMIDNLRAEKKIYFEEMVKRGEEVSQMIRIFLAVKDILPGEFARRIEKIAKQYAKRNDKDRGSVPEYFQGRIDVREDGPRGINKIREERFNDKKYSINL